MTFNLNKEDDSTDYFAGCFEDGTLTAFKPGTKFRSAVRLIPEIAADGTIKPMFEGFGAKGPQFSNGHNETMVIGAGEQDKATCFTRCSDRPNLDVYHKPWDSLYIHMRAELKKPGLNEKDRALFSRLTDRSDEKPSLLPKAAEYLLLQGIVFLGNDTLLNPPLARACIILSSSAIDALGKVLNDAAKAGVDLFDYQKGHVLEIFGERPRPKSPPEFRITVGQQMPVPSEYQNLWIPWAKALKFQTYDEHVRRMVDCFGASVVAKRPSLANAMIAMGITIPAEGAAPAAPTPKVAAAPVATPAGFAYTPSAAMAAPVVAPVATPPVQPTGFTYAPAQPAASAPVAGGFSFTPTVPAATTPPQAHAFSFAAPAGAPPVAPGPGPVVTQASPLPSMEEMRQRAAQEYKSLLDGEKKTA